MNLAISIAQISVIQSKPEENLKKGEAFIAEAAKGKSDIICFPEMWTTGFNWENNKKIAGEHEKIIDKIADLAKRYKIWINGSMLALNENGKLSNTSFLFNSTGEKKGVYRKIHLFSTIHEDENLEAGKSLCTVETPWGVVGSQCKF